MLSLETSQCQVDSNTPATFYLEGYGVVIIKSNNVLSEIGGITRRQLKDFTGASLIFAIVGEVTDGCMYVLYVYVYTIIIITVHTQFHYNNIMYMSGSEKRDIFHTFVYLRFFTSFECSVSEQYNALFSFTRYTEFYCYAWKYCYVQR